MANGYTIEEIVERAEDVIKALTPSFEPGHPYILHDGAHPLDSDQLKAHETLRRFSVHARLDYQPTGNWASGDVTDALQTVVITLRYDVPQTRGGWRRAQLLAASDCMRISHELARPKSNMRHLIVRGRPQRNPDTRHLGQGVYLATLQVEVKYIYGGG